MSIKVFITDWRLALLLPEIKRLFLNKKKKEREKERRIREVITQRVSLSLRKEGQR